MIKIINVYKNTRILEMTQSSNIGLGVKTDNNVDILRFNFDDLIIGTATMLTTLQDNSGNLVAFPLTLNQSANSYDLEITEYLASQTNFTIQLEIVSGDVIWHSRQANVRLDECLNVGSGTTPTTIENWLTNANIVLNEMEDAIRQAENLDIEVGNKSGKSYPITFTDKEGHETTIIISDGLNGSNGKDGVNGKDGKDATINGKNTLTIQAGENINISQSGSTMTISSTASGGTSDYSDLSNKPSINNVTLSGNKTLSDLGIQPSGSYMTDIQIDGNSVTTSGVASLVTYGTYEYEEDTNPLMTEIGTNDYIRNNDLILDGQTTCYNTFEVTTSNNMFDINGININISSFNNDNDTSASIDIKSNGDLEISGDNVTIEGLVAPTTNNMPATKKYVDDICGNIESLLGGI